MPGRILELFGPILRLMPEIKPPEKRINFNEKLFWTGLVLVIYLLMTEIPLYGVLVGEQADPYFLQRVIFASNHGSLMELGIQPIVTAGLIIQLLTGSGLIGLDSSNPDHRKIIAGITKLFSIIMTVVLIIAYIVGGAYGRDLSLQTSLIIFAQLFVAGIIVMLLDELLEKGWGLGSGISLFIAAGVAQRVIWDGFCPLPFPATEENGKSIGAVIAYIQSLINGENPLGAFVQRANSNAPTMLGFTATIIILLICIYIEGMKIQIPISHAKYRGFRGQYPVKLLYVSNIPVIFVSSLFMDLHFLGQIIWSRFNYDGSNPWLSWIGIFDPSTNRPTSGLVKYLSGPGNLSQFLQDPLSGLINAGLMIMLCILFAVIWLEVGGIGSGTVAKQLVDSGMQIPGFRRSIGPIKTILDRYIPTIAVLGAIIIGAIASFANFFGVFGTGTGILLTVGIFYQYYQIILREQMTEAYPLIRRFLGKS